MYEFFLTTEPGVGALITFIGVAGGVLIGLVAVIGNLHYKHRRLEFEASLKQQMLDRGMSAGEIQQVLQTTMRDKRSLSDQKEQIPVLS